jgi:FkbM family methyltransferase
MGNWHQNISNTCLFKLYTKCKLGIRKFKGKKTYSQCGEDIIIRFVFDNFGINKPSYMDIGAHHPFYFSNTALFYKNGSKGINIEPDPVLFCAFKKYRKKDINLNIGILDKQGAQKFYLISEPTLNTFSEKEAKTYEKISNYKIINEIDVKIDTIHGVLDKFWNGTFPHFLNIDAEGVDEIILNSINFKSNYPLVICIETNSFTSGFARNKNKGIIDCLLNNGYFVYADTYINTIFVHNDYLKVKFE